MNTVLSPAAAPTDCTRNAPVAAADRTPVRPGYGMGRTTWRIFRSNLFDPMTIAFTIGFPVLMYVIFGTNSSYANIPVPHGNVSAHIMLSMGQFGAAMAVSQLVAALGLEWGTGWLRTVALTPLGVRAYVLSKGLAALGMAATTTIIVYALGFGLKAHMDGPVWIYTFLIICALSLLPALLGMAVALNITGPQAFGILGGLLPLLGFLSGMFIPLDQLSEFFQVLAKFTPLWGMNQLALAPLHGWDQITWQPIANVVVWFVIIVAAVALALRKVTRRG